MINRINSSLAKVFGVKVVKSKSLLPEELGYTHPLLANYKAKKTFVIDLPMNKGRVWRWYTASTESYCPLVLCAKNYLENTEDKDRLRSILKYYYKSIKGHDGNEALGLYGDNSTFPIGEHQKKISFPWDRKNPDQFYKNWNESKQNEINTHKSRSENKTKTNDYLEFISNLEVERTIKLVDSIKKNGLIYEPTNCIGAIILIDGQNWRWSVNGGQHRTSVMAALGENYVKCLVKNIIRRSDVEYWPNVQSGLYSKKAALKVFDQMYNAELPPVYHPWKKIAQEKIL